MAATALTRRSFVALAALAGASVAAGCAPQAASEPASGASSRAAESAAAASSSAAESSASQAASAAESASSATAEPSAAEPAAASEPAIVPAGDGTELVLIFSRAGENYSVGYVETGNTMVLAQFIAQKTGADLFELTPADPYPEVYEETTARAKAEQEADARPALVSLPNLAPYGTVYFGFPVWWGDIPMPVMTAIEGLDWAGKVIRPFNTHAGSGNAGMFERLKSLCAGATVEEGLTVAGTTAQNDRTAAEAAVDGWLA